MRSSKHMNSLDLTGHFELRHLMLPVACLLPWPNAVDQIMGVSRISMSSSLFRILQSFCYAYVPGNRAFRKAGSGASFCPLSRAICQDAKRRHEIGSPATVGEKESLTGD